MKAVDPAKSVGKECPMDANYRKLRFVVFAEDQPEYEQLPARIGDNPIRVMTCWELSEEEKKIVARDGKVYLNLLTYGQPLQPIQISVEPIE